MTPPSIVIDGLSSTLYACLKDRLLWIHEVGGIANIDHWLGPVAAEADEMEGMTPPIHESKESSP